MNNDAANPAAGPACNNPPNNPIVMEYNANRMEMLAFATRFRRWIGEQPNDVQQEIRAEMLVIFREFGRAFPASRLGELEGLQLVLRLLQNSPGAATEFALAIAPHQPLVAAFRRLREYI